MIFRSGTVRHRTSQVRMILLMMAAVLGGRFAARADEYDTLRLKWLDNLTMGTNANPSDPSYSGWISSIGSVAQNNWTSMRTNATRTYLWNDFDQLGANSADLTATYERLRAMAMGYAVRGSTLEGNADLRGAIINGLDWMHTNYYNEAVTNEYDNWYDWEIGVPLNLNDITVLLYDNLTAAQVANYMNAVDHFTPTPNLTAANEVWTPLTVGVLFSRRESRVRQDRPPGSPSADY
jgi:hyaluronate lyase